MRYPLIAVFAACLASCIGYMPDTPKTISARKMAEPRMHDSMRHAAIAGPLNIEAVVYKPALPPLAGMRQKLSRHQYRRALREAHLRYEPSNADDAALKALVKHGYIPVLVDILNTGDESVDLHNLQLGLSDAKVDLAPIPFAELPTRLDRARPQAALTNTYNVAIVAVGYATLLAYVLAETGADHVAFGRSGRDHSPWGDEKAIEISGTLRRPQIRETGAVGDSYALARDFTSQTLKTRSKLIDEDGDLRPQPLFELGGGARSGKRRSWRLPEYIAGMDMSTDNDVITPLVQETPIDYNGLLYRPVTLAPGQSCRGLLFFKSEGVDLTDLQLEGVLSPPIVPISAR